MTEPAHTPLHALHVALGARMVPFAGYSMPLQYPTGIIREHTHARTRAGLFDVSHMGQLRLGGADAGEAAAALQTPGAPSQAKRTDPSDASEAAAALQTRRGHREIPPQGASDSGAAARALETLTPADIVDLPDGRQRYMLLTNDNGGAIDDCMAANLDGELLLVVNAATKASDIDHLRERIGAHCRIEARDHRALLALQGPQAASVLARYAPETESLEFMSIAELSLAGSGCQVSRSGYTGEDGFEISVDAAEAEALARELLSHAEVEPIGLGARDSLRLEAGLCLYGQDLDTSTTLVEAGLSWTVAKSRRPGGTRPGGYPGADVVERQLASGAARRRVALLPRSRVPLRPGAVLSSPDGSEAGKVTSGGFGPTLGAPIAMGYVETSLARPGTMLSAAVRGKAIPVEVAKPPAVPHRYVRRGTAG